MKLVCNNCIYCEYRTSRYHCLYGSGDYIVTGKDPACEDFILSALPALHDKNRATPRAMGMQWTPAPNPFSQNIRGENL